MREILFREIRGKRIDNREWVEGCLLIDYITGQYFIHRYGNSVNESDRVGEEGFLRFLAFEVDPSTICQYTGLHDKTKWEELSEKEQQQFLSEWNYEKDRKNQKEDWKGNKIWENDIVKFDVYKYEKLVSSTISEIKWCKELCSLSVVVNDLGTRGTLGHFNDFNKTVEVIGNIFDNPELMEGELC